MLQRTCDLCEKEQVELIFKAYDDYQDFLQYGALPHGLRIELLGMLQTRGGKAFHLWPEGVSAVVCDKCLAGGDKEAILNQIAEKPRIIQEAIAGFGRAIARDEAELTKKQAELKNLKTQVLRGEEDVKNRAEYLQKQKKRRDELVEKLKTL